MFDKNLILKSCTDCLFDYRQVSENEYYLFDHGYGDGDYGFTSKIIFFEEKATITVNIDKLLKEHRNDITDLLNSFGKGDKEDQCTLYSLNDAQEYFEQLHSILHSNEDTSNNKSNDGSENNLATIDEVENCASYTEYEQKVKARKGQDKYRQGLMDIWQGGCAVTGVYEPVLLRASHAKPWSVCNSQERLNPNNGLLLNVALDALFDKFLISFDESGRILINSKLNLDELAECGISKKMAIKHPLNSEQQKFLSYHREEFRKRDLP